MRTTNTSARKDRAGKHNDRQFDVSLAAHIDSERSKDNCYYTYDGSKDVPLHEVELKFYKDTFKDYLDAKNEACIERRQYNRVKQMEQYVKDKNTRPEDVILQIGTNYRHADGEALWQCAMDYKDKFNRIYGDHCKILDMSLHLDEDTPHVHVRRVWIYEDDNGYNRVGQNKALEQMGVNRPEPSLPEGRYNNAKMTFTKTDQALFHDVCLERGMDLEPQRTNTGAKHLETSEFKEEMERQKSVLREDIKKITEQYQTMTTEVDDLINNMMQFMEQNALSDSDTKKRLNRMRQMEREEQLKEVTKFLDELKETIVNEESLIAAITIANRSSHDAEKLKQAEAFIKKHGLEEEYKKFSVPRQQQREKRK